MKGSDAPLVGDVLRDFTPREDARPVGNLRSETTDAQGFTRVAQSAPPVSPAPGRGAAGEEMRADTPEGGELDVQFPCRVARPHRAVGPLEHGRGRGRAWAWDAPSHSSVFQVATIKFEDRPASSDPEKGSGPHIIIEGARGDPRTSYHIIGCEVDLAIVEKPKLVPDRVGILRTCYRKSRSESCISTPRKGADPRWRTSCTGSSTLRAWHRTRERQK